MSANRRPFDRQLLLALLIAAAVLVPRGIIIMRAHSPCWDDDFHLSRGLLFLRHDFTELRHWTLNDPPLGEALSAIPAWLNGVHMPDPQKVFQMPPDQPPPPEYRIELPDSIRIETAIWKSLLFLPAIGIIFNWVRSIYSIRSAWLALAMILAEPTLAAHMPMPTLDVLGMEAILIAIWAIWRFLQIPTAMRAAAAGLFIALALLIKHTALALPAAAGVLVLLHLLWKLRIWNDPPLLSRYICLGLLAIVCVPVFIWLLCWCDVHDGVPAAIYISALKFGVIHAQAGHNTFLLGESKRLGGWWYYFPVVAWFKIPWGIFGLFLLAFVSLKWFWPTYQETPLLIAATVWIFALMAQSVDIGFRHFLVPEIFLIMLASRSVARISISLSPGTPEEGRGICAENLAANPHPTLPQSTRGGEKCVAAVTRSFPGRPIEILAWLLASFAAIDMLAWTPDYLSYVNFPYAAPYLDISDSNLDWGQAIKELRQYIDTLPADGTPIYFGYFGPIDKDLYDELGPRLTEYSSYSNWMQPPPDRTDLVRGLMPDHGILIVSPTALTGQYDDRGRFASLRLIPPIHIIGHCLLVYDLDKLRASGNIQWLLPPGMR